MRSAGILLHPTSLPGRFGIGDLGPGAESFLQWAEAAGITLWQVLPLGPTGFGNSPYGCLSSFAGNPNLISPERLLEEGFLPPGESLDVWTSASGVIDFGPAIEWKQHLLRRCFGHFQQQGTTEQRRDFDAFNAHKLQAGWLDHWALFMALKAQHGDADWSTWPEPFLSAEGAASASISAELVVEVTFHKFLQFLFFRQWERVRDIARNRGIRVMGDVPIYVAYDSADVWSNAALFLLDEKRKPLAVAGVPPDYFSSEGQRWGNPLYRWDRMAEDGYRWWIARTRANLRLTDVVRLDHFRGFAGFWQIPAGEESAAGGHWVKGPGLALFAAIRKALGDLPIVAEDLGLITPDVDQLRDAIGVAGMKVLQFGFGDLDNIHLPHRFVTNTVVYTGTHDNDTTCGWFASLTEKERTLVLDYTGDESGEQIHWKMMRLAFNSVAELAIVPMQDVLGLGSKARMNTPGRSDGNWQWRALAEDFSDVSALRLRRLIEISGRLQLSSSIRSG